MLNLGIIGPSRHKLTLLNMIKVRISAVNKAQNDLQSRIFIAKIDIEEDTQQRQASITSILITPPITFSCSATEYLFQRFIRHLIRLDRHLITIVKGGFHMLL